jgi:flagellar hook protein FlgE
MSLLTSLTSGTTGLASASTELSVIGDNIANANTVGFKAQRAAFEDTLAQTVIGGTGQIGLGSRLESIQKIITQGALQNTGVATDLALQGSGFFEVKGATGDGRFGTYLTRAGQFTVDREGFLVNLEGLKVQGYGADSAGQVTSALGDLQVGNASAAPRATTGITLKANLSAEAPIVTAPWNPAQAAATSSFSSSATVYDSLGKDTQVQLYFRRTGASTWEYHALVDGAVQGGAAGTPVEITTGTNTLTFDTEGKLQAIATGACTLSPTGANSQPLTFDLGDAVGAGGTGLGGITQFAAASAATFVGQDGYGSGQLTSVQIDKQGVIQGVFTNGQMRALGQVGVARVAAPESLERTGGNLYAVTRASGEAVMGAAGDGGRAFISAGTLEQSNVDIAEQFVRMISAQRAFEANSKTITTADQLLSELISMKR